MSSSSLEDIAGYGVYALSSDQCIAEIVDWVEHGDSARFCACANPHSVAVAARRPEFRTALLAAHWLTPDGQGIVIASRLFGGRIRERITGTDIFIGLSKALSERGTFKIFFLGSSERTLQLIRERFSREYPHLVIVGTYSPPFSAQFSEEDTKAMIDAVNAAQPDVLWVGMTAPKQELWIHQNLGLLNVRFVGAIGAVFDFFAGTVIRPGPVFQQLGLEWLVRALHEPRRLWRRTVVSAPQFAWLVAKYRRGADA